MVASTSSSSLSFSSLHHHHHQSNVSLAMSSWYSPLGSWPPDHHCSPPLIIIKIINTVNQFYWQHNPCNENQSLKDQILRSALRLSRHRWQTSDHHCQFPIKDSAIPSHFHLCHQNFLIQVKNLPICWPHASQSNFYNFSKNIRLYFKIWVLDVVFHTLCAAHSHVVTLVHFFNLESSDGSPSGDICDIFLTIYLEHCLNLFFAWSPPRF